MKGEVIFNIGPGTRPVVDTVVTVFRGSQQCCQPWIRDEMNPMNLTS